MKSVFREKEATLRITEAFLVILKWFYLSKKHKKN